MQAQDSVKDSTMVSKAKCTASGIDWICEKPAHRRKLCSGHYTQQRKGKPLTFLQPPHRIKETDKTRLIALLNTPCLSFAEIGRRMGVSKEAIRLIAKKKYVTGKTRGLACAFEMQPIIKHPFVIFCKDKGFKVDLVRLRRYGYSKKLIHVNGWICSLRTATKRKDSGIIKIARAKSLSADFIIYCVTDVLFLIIPRAKCPTRDTAIGEKRWREDTTDWHVYKNAWEQLNKKREIFSEETK